ncbi:glutaredoxin-like protein DUF836 [Panacagrimonas perspica]|uniref:Glutaredoxin-like protein DUF836 n=1 Tax=Panacagrimonas perspica TaxID=381431 RepID=A0A4R7NY97_9GAMM|nr:glutaredoxin family protein [Panacagrimonas perspica]TDU25862.1 glutaredoxin-like protein DUF836 [Panacagrimonas perspica]THD02772.1 hypothetical protein B1810_12685 [Panacagrimonas perspica]
MTEILLLLGRPECGLCEEMEIALRSHHAFEGVELQHADVDSQADWQRRYGLRVPVLLDRWGDVVCEGHFDTDAFSAWRLEMARRGA